MKLLLDTHTFIWWDSDPARLSTAALAGCMDAGNELVVSAASIWEIQIKRQLGKLALRLPLVEILERQRSTNAITILSIEPSHVLALDALPTVHKDPFDRILAAQAVTDGMALVSGDAIFKSYPVSVVW